MSMEKRRDEIGKLLVCLLVSRKGASRIEELERDYRENEGRSIPYKEFGCISLIDFFRSISKHVKVESRCGKYMIYPVVSDKIKHVDDLVCRQRPARRNTSFRRRPARSSRYYPTVRDPKPFVPHAVQQEVAKILTSNPTGVNKSYIAQCLERSDAIAGTVNLNNIDEYLSSMPYTASTRGNMVFPSPSLRAIIDTNTRRKQHVEDINGFDVVTPGNSETVQNTSCRNNQATTTGDSYPAGTEEDEYYDEDEYYEDYENENPPTTSINVDNNYAAAENSNRHRMSSAEFIGKAGVQYSQAQDEGLVRQNMNLGENCHENGVADRDEEDSQSQDNEDCTFISDDDGDAIDIISPRVKSRLQQLIEKNPDGIWCADLLQAYLNEFNVPLDYADLGFGSVCELASNIPTVFHLHRHNNRGDFMLYDATKPIPESAEKRESQAASTAWQNEYYDDDVDPFPMALPLVTSRSLVPQGVMTHGESVGQERIPEITNLTECLEVYVVEVYTPSLFWIHLRKKRAKLSRLMESMHEFYQSNGDTYTIPHVILEKGLNCVCTFEDKWHRAIIKTVKPDGNVTLVFYDYGTRKTYPPDSLRFLVRTYSHLPAQAIPCGLFNVKPVNANAWTKGVSAEFYNQVADTPLIAMVGKVDKENNSMLVSLVDTHGDTDEHINDWLVQKGLAENGFMGDTVSLECVYLEDLITQDLPTIAAQQDVPLITLQSTLPECSGVTLKPPPGLAKPTQPMNYAAFMNECLHGTNYPTADLANSTFINSDSGIGNANLNNNPLVSLLANSSPLSEAFIQFCKQRMELAEAVNQFFLSNNTSSVLNNTILNNTSTAASSTFTNTNPILEQSCTNPFLSYQENRKQGNSSDRNTLGELTNAFLNLNISESNHCDAQKNTTLPNFDSRDSKPSAIHEGQLFPSQPMDGFATARNDFTDLGIDQNSYTCNAKSQNDKEFIGQGLHDTNPFKEHLIGNFDIKFKSGGEERSLKRDFENKETVIKPPIPPRNPNLINATFPVYNKPENNPTTKIYYQADPVMYNNNSKTEIKSTIGQGTAKSNESEQQCTESFKQDLLDTLHQRKVPSKTSGSGSSAEDTKPIFIKQESNFTSYQEFYNPTEAFPKNSERPESDLNLFGTGTTSNRRTAEACPSPDTRQNENSSSAMPTLHNQQNSVIGQDLYHRDSNSNITFKRDTTTVDENRSKFSNTELPGNRMPQTNPYQPRPLFPPQFPPSYPNIGDLYHGQTHPSYHHMPYPDVRPHPPVSPRPVPLFRPNVHGFYPPPPPGHWPRPQFLNPAFPYMHGNGPPTFQHPYAWNPYRYNPNMFPPKQTIYNHGTTISNSQTTTTETDLIEENVDVSSSKLSHGQTLFGEENKENVNSVQNEDTKFDLTKFRKHSTDRTDVHSPITDPVSSRIPEQLTNTESNEESNSKDCNLPMQLDEFDTPIADDKKSDNEIKNFDEKEICADNANGDKISSGSLPQRNYSDKSSNETVNTKETSRRDINNIFKPVEVNNQTIYLFNIENEGWASTDEIALVFTNFENRHSILRILDDIVQLQINFMEVSRAQSPLVFDQLDGTTIRLPRMTNSKKIKGTLHLTPLKSLIPMMYYLKVISIDDIRYSHVEKRLPPGSRAFELLKLIKAYNSNDEYWIG